MTRKKSMTTSAVSPVEQTIVSSKATAGNASDKQVYEGLVSANNTSPTKVDTQQQYSSSANAAKRNPAIDGLRALAIIGIVCFHMRPSLLPGGFLGVTLFLVLSGYFCTASVLKYIAARKNTTHPDNTSNTSKIRHYWQYLWHRIKRIWPPTIGVIAITAPIMWLCSPSLLPKLQADALPGAGFFSNITYVVRKLSYFEQSGLPSPIKHLWYLGLVMQAFIVWPLILTALVTAVRKPALRMYITAGLVVLSAALTFAFAYASGNYETPARVYYSLDTRASEFLLGAMLAMYNAWFSKHSLHIWIVRVVNWLRGNKHVIVTLSSTQDGITKDDSHNVAQENTSRNVSNSSEILGADGMHSHEDDGIPEDLRAGLQIDLSEDNDTFDTTSTASSAQSSSQRVTNSTDISELPDDVFKKPKNVVCTPLTSWQHSAIGAACAVVLCCCFVYADGASPLLVFGGYTLTAVFCTLLLWSCISGTNICARIFSWAPLAYLGRRSFSIYLVHFPLLELCNPATRTTSASFWEQLLQALAIVVIAECFYQIFEKQVTGNRLLATIHYVAITLCFIVTLAIVSLPVNWQAIAQQRAVQLRPELTVADTQQNAKQKTDQPQHAKDTSGDNTSTKYHRTLRGLHKNVAKQALPPTPSRYRVLFPIAEKVPNNLKTSHTRIDQRTGTCSVNLTMVGDSITEGAKPYLMQAMPNAYIDGKVSRQIFHGADEYEQDISGKHAGDIVIYALGTNGPPRDDSVLQHMVDVAKGKPVYFVTTRVPQPWQDTTNERLRNFAATHPNVGIINWHGLSEGHSEYLTDDGVHLTPVGGPQYAKMIRLAVCGG